MQVIQPKRGWIGILNITLNNSYNNLIYYLNQIKNNKFNKTQ